MNKSYGKLKRIQNTDDGDKKRAKEKESDKESADCGVVIFASKSRKEVMAMVMVAKREIERKREYVVLSAKLKTINELVEQSQIN